MNNFKIIVTSNSEEYLQNIVDFFNEGGAMNILDFETTNKDLKNVNGYHYIDKKSVNSFSNKMLEFTDDKGIYFTNRKNLNQANLIAVKNPMHIYNLADIYKNTLIVVYNFIVSDKDAKLLKAKAMLDKGETLIDLSNIKEVEGISLAQAKITNFLNNSINSQEPFGNITGSNINVNASFTDFSMTTNSIVDFLIEITDNIDSIELFVEAYDTVKEEKDEDGILWLSISDPNNDEDVARLRKAMAPFYMVINEELKEMVNEGLFYHFMGDIDDEDMDLDDIDYKDEYVDNNEIVPFPLNRKNNNNDPILN